MAKPVSKHTANQPAFYREPIAMNQDKFYMPKSILRPVGFQTEEMSTEDELVIKVPAIGRALEAEPAKEAKEAKENKKAKASAKKEA